MPGLIDIKRRIKSIQSMRKITRAMQMVSAAKMRKAQEATLASRRYSSLAWELILNLSSSEQIRAELLKTHPRAQKMAIVVLSSNMGLVGSLNSNLISTVQKVIDQNVTASAETGKNSGYKEDAPITQADFITYGKKGRDFVIRSYQDVLADFEKFDRAISTKDIYPIAEFLTDLYKSRQYKKVVIVYNHFVSTLVQKPSVKQLLPLPRSIMQASQAKKDTESVEYQPSEYLFEPTPRSVMGHLLPRIIESQIYQTILEAEASEQSARMVMMKNATEAAGDLISHLTLTYNKLRQNKITTELTEITAGKIALE